MNMKLTDVNKRTKLIISSKTNDDFQLNFKIILLKNIL